MVLTRQRDDVTPKRGDVRTVDRRRKDTCELVAGPEVPQQSELPIFQGRDDVLRKETGLPHDVCGSASRAFRRSGHGSIRRGGYLEGSPEIERDCSETTKRFGASSPTLTESRTTTEVPSFQSKQGANRRDERLERRRRPRIPRWANVGSKLGRKNDRKLSE